MALPFTRCPPAQFQQRPRGRSTPLPNACSKARRRFPRERTSSGTGCGSGGLKEELPLLASALVVRSDDRFVDAFPIAQAHEIAQRGPTGMGVDVPGPSLGDDVGERNGPEIDRPPRHPEVFGTVECMCAALKRIIPPT